MPTTRKEMLAVVDKMDRALASVGYTHPHLGVQWSRDDKEAFRALRDMLMEQPGNSAGRRKDNRQ
jgi:hypothetical protein